MGGAVVTGGEGADEAGAAGGEVLEDFLHRARVSGDGGGGHLHARGRPVRRAGGELGRSR
jgi:hypothetical protein